MTEIYLDLLLSYKCDLLELRMCLRACDANVSVEVSSPEQ